MQAVQHPSQSDSRTKDETTQIYIVADVQKKPAKAFLILKRCVDILLSLFFGLLLLPAMMLIGILVWCSSPGPALYRQERLGLNGKKFIMLKFRSMTKDAEAEGPKWADNNDERCTKVGAFLRKTRLDELPQLWNIFKGDMSFVGPRPEREYFYDQFETYIVGFRKRLLAKPGLTGLAQVNGGYDLLPEEKILYDMQYIEHMSVMLDLKCLFKTIRLFFTHEGAR